MAKVSEIVKYFAELVPPAMKMDFDNVGLLVGTSDSEVKKAVIALDITDAVIDEAISENAQIILSHHPMFFERKTVNDGDPIGARIVKLITHGISALCQHTNLDSVQGGVNDALTGVLGLENCDFLEGPDYLGDRAYGIGRIGELSKETTMDEFLPFVKDILKTSGLRYVDAGRPVKKVAVCGGSGGDLFPLALEKGCDTLVTADVKYHQFMDAKDLGINVIDADHFCTENVVVPVLAKMLSEGFPEIEIIISKVHGQTIQFA